MGDYDEMEAQESVCERTHAGHPRVVLVVERCWRLSAIDEL